MAVYNGAARSITSSLTNSNYTLSAGASKSCRVLSVLASGEGTSSLGMHTRHTRASGWNGTATAITIEKTNPNSPTAGLTLTTGAYGTTQPTQAAGDLLAFSWNVHGGIMYWHSGSPDEEWVMIGAADPVTTASAMTSRNSVGASTSSYGVTWRED